MGGGVEGEWHVHHLPPSHAISRKRLGRLSTNFAWRVTDSRQMFCTSQVRIAIAHVHNIFLLYLATYKTVKNQLLAMATIGLKFGGWVAGTKWTRTVPPIGGYTLRGCVVKGGVARAPPTYHTSHAISRRRLGPYRLPTHQFSARELL